MKSVLLTLTMLIAIPNIGSAEDSMHPLDGHSLYRLQIEGLVCAFCAYNVESRLHALSGVEYVDVDVESGSVLVGMEPNQGLDNAQVQKVVEEAGFSLVAVDRRPMTLEELSRR